MTSILETCLDERDEEVAGFWNDIPDPQQNLRSLDGYEDTPLVPLEVAIESIVNYCPDIYDHFTTAISKSQRSADGLSQDESAAIYLYTMHWEPRKTCLYYVLNNTLRKQKRKEIRPWLLFLKLLLTALQKLPSHDGIIWRGIKLNLIEEYEIGQTVIWWSLSSCTQAIGILESDLLFGSRGARTLFNIECQNGKIIRSHSSYFVEDEVLLLPGTQLTVKSKLKLATDTVVIHLKEIDSLLLRSESSNSISTDYLPAQIRVTNEGQRTHLANDKLERLISQYPMNGIVNLNGQGISDDDILMVVKQLIEKKKPSVLQICSNHITGQGAQQLAKALQTNSSINQLNMRDNNISEIGARAVAEILCTNSMLTSINLVCNHINDEGATCLARSLNINTTLTKLYLANNAINGNSIRRFAQALTHNRTLTMLDLSSNGITDNQIVYLAAMLQKNSTLRILGLAENPLTNAGVKFLMHALRKNQGLQGLNIACLGLSHGCIRDIQNMFRRNHTLVELWLSSRAFSAFSRLKLWSINRSLNTRQIRFVQNNRNHTE